MAFEIDGSKWIGAKTDFYVNSPGISRTGVSWNLAFIQAAKKWNEETDFNFNIIGEAMDPCLDDGLSSVAFSTDMCGKGFGISTLAVTVMRYQSQLLGPAAIVEADIFVKDDVDFDIYDGDNLLRAFYPDRIDYRRAMVHELGHVIGLNHEEINQAIMQPRYGDIYRLQKDDILGVNTLYSGLTNCNINSLKLGVTQNSLDFSDCTVKELTVGGNDESLVDMYKFSLTETAALNFSIFSNQLESVIIVADKDLNYISSDSDISGGCDANLKPSLGPGEYFLIVNTFDAPVKESCELIGDYELLVSYSGSSSQQLGPAISTAGTKHAAEFTGKITANDGANFGNKFTPSDSLDISATVSIDQAHRGQSGFFVVAARIDNQFLFLNDQGLFINSQILIPYLEKKLEAVEVIQIANNLVAADFGIADITVDFFVGYGVSSAPDEIYFHETPLNLIISPLGN